MGKISETFYTYKNGDGEIIVEKVKDGVKTLISTKETPESLLKKSLAVFTTEQKEILEKLLRLKPLQ